MHSLIEAILLALALCVDSLVVSTTTAFKSKMHYGNGILLALVFGFCQGAFPLLGALLGEAFRSVIESVDHWVAFGLLLLIGGKMIWDGIRNHEGDGREYGKVNIGTMFLLGVATSIDSFAVGIGLGLNESMGEVLVTVLIIGVVTAIVSMVGVYLGKRNIPVPERTATILAGVVLIGLGAKILVEHLLLA